MKKKLFIVSIILLITLPAFNIKIAKCASRPRVDWAILIAGTNAGLTRIRTTAPSEEALRNCYYMFHVLKDHFEVPRNHIMFLHIRPSEVKGSEVPYNTIDAPCTKAEVQSSISWVKTNCEPDDNVLIFVTSHGSRFEDTDGDEKDGSDEALVFYDYHDHTSIFEAYYDDDLRQDLEGLECNELVVVLQSCFSGGFIDDLGASGRIIITASSETTVAQGDDSQSGTDHDGFSPFSEHFIDALHGYNTTWNLGVLSNLLIHENPITMPDYNGDGAVSWEEAYIYAKEHDLWDTPCFVDYNHLNLHISSTLWGRTVPCVGDYTYSYGENAYVTAVPWTNCIFDYWMLDGQKVSNNPTCITMNRHHSLKAYFHYNSDKPGGDGCPTLYSWNGSAYVDYGVIDIHNPTGEDMVKEVSIAKQDLAVEDHKAKLQLQEGWLGLNYSESVIDQVKLYAIDESGKLKQCPLTTAVHSRLGDVYEYLVASDDVKAQTFLLETIDLTFKVREDSQGFIFIIEGCNQLKN